MAWGPAQGQCVPGKTIPGAESLLDSWAFGLDSFQDLGRKERHALETLAVTFNRV